jgi:4'-phosphopantetheinyl transferase
MIRWLVQSATEDDLLARGSAPMSWLHPTEQERLARLKRARRRHDWLLGRWTAKRLLQACIEHDSHQCLPLDVIVIDNDGNGAPIARVYNASTSAAWNISISHRHDSAFCATSTVAPIGLGADIERIEPRDGCFVEDYFTGDEIQRVRGAAREQQDTLVTAIWSAKEAALKALHLGMTIDTRQVNCTIDPRGCAPLDWSAFKITCTHGCDHDLQGWWRVWNNDVLTLAIYDARMWPQLPVGVITRATHALIRSISFDGG